MDIGIEIDNVISTQISNKVAMNEISECAVLKESRAALEKLKAMGHTVILYTSRDASLGPETEIWLNKHKIPYDTIIFNKPVLDIIIGKNCYKFDNWSAFLEKYKYHLGNN